MENLERDNQNQCIKVLKLCSNTYVLIDFNTGQNMPDENNNSTNNNKKMNARTTHEESYFDLRISFW